MKTSLLFSLLNSGFLRLGSLLLLSAGATLGQVNLQEPAVAAPWQSQEAVRMAFTLPAPYAAAGKVRVKVNGPLDAVTSNEITQSAAGDYLLSVNLFDGANTITVIGFGVGGVPAALQTWNASCAGRWCKAPFSLTATSVVSVLGAPIIAPPVAVASGIEIKAPVKDATFENETFISSTVKVTNATITKVFIRVLNEGKPVAQAQNSFSVEKNADATLKPIKASIRIGLGRNEITAFDPAPGAAGTDSHTIVVRCIGDRCGTESDVATIVTNSENTRALVGMEQVGASSTTSETKPFLDFFFTGPLLFTGRAPRLATWGNVRLASTPDQVTNTGIFPTNLVNQVGSSGTAGSLVQSFDFLAGLEGRVYTSKGSFLGLIPGVRQKTRVYLAAGAGAISPLTAKRESAQIFSIPKPDDSQRDLFVDRYGTPPPGKEFVAFVPLDRDRFLRQWYAGLRFKTYYCEDEDCTRFRNSFPGMLDFMFGQNEAVTGGSRKYGGSPDPTDNTKIVGEKNAYVVRVDAFYPLPFREARFLYLYGTAMMKVGGGRTKIINPLFLDPATILITDPKVFIPPADLQQLLQPNRDYYKIGVGINLTDLFNRSRTPPE